MNTTLKVTKLGKPTLSNREVNLIFRKLEPYLRAGLSLHAACLKADVPKSTVYDLYAENKEFAEIDYSSIDASKKVLHTYYIDGGYYA